MDCDDRAARARRGCPERLKRNLAGAPPFLLAMPRKGNQMNSKTTGRAASTAAIAAAGAAKTGRAALTAVVVLAGAALLPAGAAAAPPATGKVLSTTAVTAAADEVLSTTATTAALTDGRGTIAFGTAPGTLRIVGPGGRSVDAAVPPECQPAVPAAIGGGQVALRCTVPQPNGLVRWEPRLVDAATGELRIPAGVDHLSMLTQTQGGLSIEGVGSVGLAVRAFGVKGSGTLSMVDWRTGAPLPVPRERREDAAQVLDLDSAAGVQTLCAPLRRTGIEEYDGWFFNPFAYAKPWGVRRQGESARTLLQRCGSARPITIAPESWGRMTLASGLVSVTGAADRRGFTYLIGCGLRLTWQLGVTATHVDGAAILSGREAEGPWEIRRVPLTGACAGARKALRLDVRAAGKAVSAAPRAARWSESSLGATATQVTGLDKAAPRLRLAAGGTATVASGRAATRVQWRTGGAWKSARRAGRRWTIAAPGLRSARTATVRATAPGSSATFAVKLLPPRR